MNISSGGLSFDFTATNDQLKKVIQESQKEIQGLADASQAGGKIMDAAFKAASERMDQNASVVEAAMSKSRQAVMRLETEISELKTQAGEAFAAGDVAQSAQIMETVKAREKEIQKHKDAIKACEDAYTALDGERERLESLRAASEEAAKSQESLRSRLRRCREELAQMEATQGPDVRQTEAFRQLQEEAGALADALSDAQAQVAVFSDDNAAISGALTGLSGLAGAFSTAQGAMALFGVENEQVQQAMLKVQSAIAITNGVQQVANALNKDSAFQLVTVRKAKELLATTELKLASALGVSTVAARVFMATITLGLSAAIGAIIYVVEKFRSAAAEAEAFNKKVAESAAEPVVKVELLAEKWKRLGDDMAAKRRFIEDNKKAFDDLGVSIRDVADAENLLINNKDAFIAAQIEKAKAAIYIEEQKEAIKELIKEEAKLPDQIRKTEEARQRALEHIEKYGYDVYVTSYTESQHLGKEESIKRVNEHYDAVIAHQKRKLDEMRDGITAGYRQAADAEEKGLQIMKDAAIEATNDGQEAADAFTTYILEGTEQAEKNLNTFGGKVRNYFDGLISDLQSSSNSFASFFGGLLGNLFNTSDGADLGDGTVGDRLDKVKKKYDQAVKDLAALRERTSTATAKDIQEAEKEVQKYADLYKTLSGITLGATSGSGKPTGSQKSQAELYAQELSDKKSLYTKYLAWVTSSDATVREAAKSSFADLLKEGKTYLDFLQGQRDSISQKANKTALDLQKLQLLNNEIAEATKDTVLNDFQKQLEADLKTCRTLGAMLDLIEQRRQSIAGDDTELGDKEREILKTAEDDTKNQMQAETDELLRTYAGYEVERYRFAETYARKHQLLAKEVLRTQKALQAQAAAASGTLLANTASAAQGITGLAGKAAGQIDAIIADLEKKRVTLNLDEAEASALSELQRIKDAIAKEDPFEVLRKNMATLKAAFASGTLDGNDPFIKTLRERKAQYEEYSQAMIGADADVAAAVRQQYSELLREGETFAASLRKQLADLEQKRVTIGLDIDQEAMASTLEAVLIAETDTAKTVAADVQAKLQEITQSLNGVTSALTAATQAAEKNGQEVSGEVKAMLADLRQLTEEASQIKGIDPDSLLDIEALQAQAAAAQKAYQGLLKEQQDYGKATSKEYADLLAKYKTHQQQLTDIQTKYAAERATAAKEGNISIMQLINKEEQEEISKLASAQLMASQTWNQLFSDIDKLGTTAIARLIKQIEAHKLSLSAELNPADLKAVEDQLERARQELQQRNPFLALRDSLAELRRTMNEKKLLADTSDPILQELEKKKKEYETIAANLADPATAPSVAIDFKATLEGGADFQTYLRNRIKEMEGQKVTLGVDFTGQHELDVLIAMLNKVQGTSKSVGEGFKETFSDVGSTIQLIAGTFDAVTNGMKKMGIQMDEETEAILGDIGGILEGAQGIATGIATGNPLSIIQGSISLFSSAFDLFNSRDRKAQASIQKHEEALGRLRNVYNELQHAIKRALGEETYQNQSALIANLRKQQQEVSGMMSDELSKKHTDSAKVEEYREQYKELGRQITDIMDEITASITQTTAKDLSGQLADALIEAFEGGEDAAKAFGEVADQVIKKAVVNALKLQMLEKPLQNAIKQLQKDMGFDEQGNGTFNGLSEAEQKRFKAAVEAAGANFQAAMDMYKGLFEQLDDSDPTTLSGAIKGASQESIDLLAGQTNAVRQNQVTTIALFRQQLIHLSNIDANIGVIAGRLLTILNQLTTPSGTSLRSQGITD